jgi:hypothetical protein
VWLGRRGFCKRALFQGTIQTTQKNKKQEIKKGRRKRKPLLEVICFPPKFALEGFFFFFFFDEVYFGHDFFSLVEKVLV